MCASTAISVDLAALIGSQLASFLAGLHNWGRQTQKGRANLSANVFGRTVMDLLGYQIAVPNAAASGIVDPLLPIVMAALAERDRIGEETAIMGDFWTANVLVSIQETASGEQTLKRLWVIDWENCRYGSPASDIAPFAADCYLNARFHDEVSAETLRHNFLQTYAALAKVDPLEVVIGMGTFWIMWAGNRKGVSATQLREYIEKGIEYIRMGWGSSEDIGDVQWLPSSLAKELVACTSYY
ncbi:hypothetical protein HWV62_1907 [Athelia sp. TMB]|nr:hypothetical protein HWV62_1907 [Athelia sp. TMB]